MFLYLLLTYDSPFSSQKLKKRHFEFRSEIIIIILSNSKICTTKKLLKYLLAHARFPPNTEKTNA